MLWSLPSRRWGKENIVSLVLQYVEFTCLMEQELGVSQVSILTWRSEFFPIFLVIEFSFLQIIEVLMQIVVTPRNHL